MHVAAMYGSLQVIVYLHANGATLDTVVGITDQAACCDACSKNLKCQRWVLGARPADLPHSPRQL